MHYYYPDDRLSLSGTDGADSLIGGSKDEVITGLSGNDELRGGPGSDEFHGGRGNDIFIGHTPNDAGADEDIDTVVYKGKIRDFRFDIATHSDPEGEGVVERLVIEDLGGDDLDEGRDELQDIDRIEFSDAVIETENIHIGTDDGEVLRGSPGRDIFFVKGGGQVIDGGRGADIFIFMEDGDSPKSGPTVLRNFNPHEGDSIALGNVDDIDMISVGNIRDPLHSDLSIPPGFENSDHHLLFTPGNSSFVLLVESPHQLLPDHHYYVIGDLGGSNTAPNPDRSFMSLLRMKTGEQVNYNVRGGFHDDNGSVPLSYSAYLIGDDGTLGSIGLTMHPDTGALSGKFTGEENAEILIIATDNKGGTASYVLTIEVSPPSSISPPDLGQPASDFRHVQTEAGVAMGGGGGGSGAVAGAAASKIFSEDDGEGAFGTGPGGGAPGIADFVAGTDTADFTGGFATDYPTGKEADADTAFTAPDFGFESEAEYVTAGIGAGGDYFVS